VLDVYVLSYPSIPTIFLKIRANRFVKETSKYIHFLSRSPSSFAQWTDKFKFISFSTIYMKYHLFLS
jgi:hypothetical protein